MKTIAALVVLATSLAIPAWAALKTITLSVPGMDCAACPIVVKKALAKVTGVQKVEVSFEKREAVVTFDDAGTDVQALRRATENAGYPSTVKR